MAPQNINSSIINQQHGPKKSTVYSGDISDFSPIPNNQKKYNDIYNEETDTINVKISDLIDKNNNPLAMVNLENNTDQAEYQKILNGLTKSISNIHSEDVFDNDTELDRNIIKSISESIQYADIPSDTIISDIPVIAATKKNIKNIPPGAKPGSGCSTRVGLTNKSVDKKSITKKQTSKSK